MRYTNSILSALKQCHKKAYWRHVRELEPIEPNIDLLAGGAFAKGIAAMRVAYYREGKSPEVAFDLGLATLEQAYGKPSTKIPTYGKTLDKLMGGFAAYIEKWPLDPYVCAVHIEERLYTTIDEFEYSGKPDFVYETENGTLWIVDEKVTGKADDAWSSYWNLESQFSGYYYLIQKNWPARRIGGVQIRGVGLHRDGPHCVEVPVTRMEWEIARWMDSTSSYINMFENAESREEWPMRADWQCKFCEYKKLCDVREPELFIQDFKKVEKNA